jgi:hypothetical protein
MIRCCARLHILYRHRGSLRHARASLRSDDAEHAALTRSNVASRPAQTSDAWTALLKMKLVRLRAAQRETRAAFGREPSSYVMADDPREAPL